MPQTLYTKVTDAAGNETLQEVEVPTQAELEALEAKVKSANAEAAARRHEVNALKQAVLPKETPDSETQTSPQTATVAPVKPVEINEDALIARAAEKVRRDLEAAAAAELAEKAKLAALIEKHNLPANLVSVLAQSKDPSAVAAELERTNLTFAGSNAGRSPKGNSVSDAAKAAFDKLGLDLN